MTRKDCHEAMTGTMRPSKTRQFAERLEPRRRTKTTRAGVLEQFSPGSAMRLMLLLSIVMALTGVGLILLSYAMGG